MATKLTWLGHGTWAIETAGTKILLDPFLDDNPTAPIRSDDVQAIRQLILDQQFEGPGGLVRIDHATRHAVRAARIGRTTPDMEFETVWLSPDPIMPKPFPDSRGVNDWDDFESELFIGWKNHWRPNAPPRSTP